MENFLGMLSGAMLSLAFVSSKPYCYVAAIVCALSVSILRSL